MEDFENQTMRMEQLTAIRQLIYNGKVDEALVALSRLLSAGLDPATDSEGASAAEPSAALHEKAEAYYLRGNAYRKLGNWQEALNDYQRAIDLDPASPAQQARRMVIDILNFYNKDMYNQ